MNQLFMLRGREIRVAGRIIRSGRLEGDGFVFIDNPDSFVKDVRECDSRIDIFTFLQRLPDTTPRYAYPFEWDNFAALPVSTFDHWWSSQIGFKARNKAKQAEKKGVVVREATFDQDLVRGIRDIYNETPVRQGRLFPHYGKSLQQVFADEATFLDRAIFIGAFFEGALIGFTKLVYDETQTQAGTMNILSTIAHRDKAPTNALIAQAVRSCAERGIRYLVYSQFAYGRKVRSGITEFKERNGFVQMDTPRYYVPLTTAGRAALRLGMHRRPGDVLPETIAAWLRDARGGWYRYKYGNTPEAL